MTMSVPCSWGIYSYCAKTRVVIRNYVIRGGAAGLLGSDSISPDQRSRTRFPFGDGSGVTTCPRGGNAQHLWPRTRTPAGGFGTSTCHSDSRRWVRDLHVPSGLPQMGSRPPRAIRTPADGSGTSTCHPDSRRWVWDLHVPSGLPQMGPGPPRAYPDPRE